MKIFSTYESGEAIELIKVLCIIPCGNRKIWDKNPNAEPQGQKMSILAHLLRSVRTMPKNFIPLPGVFFLQNMDFYFQMI